MAGRDVGTDRQRAGPYDGHGRCHRLGSLPASVPNEARRDPSRSGGPLNPGPAGAAGGSIIAKEHGRTPAGDAQEIRPSTAAISRAWATVKAPKGPYAAWPGHGEPPTFDGGGYRA